MKKIILTLLLISPFLIFSQYKITENLTEAEASSYLKLEGYNFNITRSETKEGLIKWQGHSGNAMPKVFMTYEFYPFNLGIYSKSKQTLTIQKPKIEKLINELPSNYVKIDKISSTEIWAYDNDDISKAKSFFGIKKNEDSYWVITDTKVFNQQIKVEDIGFDYGFNDEIKRLNFLSEDTYDLTGMVTTFILDYNFFLLKKIEDAANSDQINLLKYLKDMAIKNQQTNIKFTKLEEDVIALSMGMNNDSEINILVDPDKWKSYSHPKRFYILYHELGHDVFNLNHGNGGKMMYNYSEKDFNWKQFMNDRILMFDTFLSNNFPKNFNFFDVEGFQKILKEVFLIYTKYDKKIKDPIYPKYKDDALKIIELEMLMEKKYGTYLEVENKFEINYKNRENFMFILFHFIFGFIHNMEGDKFKSCNYLEKFLEVNNNLYPNLESFSRSIIKSDCANLK